MAAALGSTSPEVIGARGWRVGRGETRKKNEILYIGGTTRPDMAAGSKTERETAEWAGALWLILSFISFLLKTKWPVAAVCVLTPPGDSMDLTTFRVQHQSYSRVQLWVSMAARLSLARFGLIQCDMVHTAGHSDWAQCWCENWCSLVLSIYFLSAGNLLRTLIW